MLELHGANWSQFGTMDFDISLTRRFLDIFVRERQLGESLAVPKLLFERTRAVWCNRLL